MYHTSADDLERVASDLRGIAQKYMDGSHQLDQQIRGLDGTASQVISSGPEKWVGLSSDAFHHAWLDRRARLQQASSLLSQGAQHLSQFAKTIEDHMLTIYLDQTVVESPLGLNSKQPFIDDESQAQNAIITALATLNSQLDALIEEVKDCPEDQEGKGFTGYGNDPYNKSDSGAKGKKDENDNNGSQPPVSPERLAQLEKNPQTGTTDPKSKLEAQSILQAEAEGLVKNARRPNLANGEPNLDFVVDGGYTEIKTPIDDPSLRSINQQAQDIARSIRRYDADVQVIIDLKNLSPADKELFITDMQTTKTNMTNVRFINQ